MTLKPGRIEQSSITLFLFLLESFYFVDNVVKVKYSHIFLELLYTFSIPPTLNFGTIDVNKLAIGYTPHPTSSFILLYDLLVAE